MSLHRDTCTYWDGNRTVLFASSDGIERVKLGYDRHCDLVIVSGYYEALEIPATDLMQHLSTRLLGD